MNFILLNVLNSNLRNKAKRQMYTSTNSTYTFEGCSRGQSSLIICHATSEPGGYAVFVASSTGANVRCSKIIDSGNWYTDSVSGHNLTITITGGFNFFIDVISI